jgi:hypothetical protein
MSGPSYRLTKRPGAPAIAHRRGSVATHLVGDHVSSHRRVRVAPQLTPQPADAAGLTSDSAAAELICAHHTWLTRAEFVTGYIDAGTRHDGHPYAYIDWEHAVALDTHQLCCSPSEAAVLRIAASLGDHYIPVHLARVLGSLDPANIALVATAITRANG